ncbi:MAG: TRAP transporter large permease subunit [Myxococcales bacterium]|nr:TRAP transporter large permease subunit [Myxococcales bacterium]
MYKLLGALLGVMAVIGMPLFAVLGAISILSWLSSDDPRHRFMRHVAANVLEDKFADSSILATIPLFVLVGYLMAESNTPRRIVRAASATLGWMPGGLAIVCIVATSIFTMLTGGSGVTIVAIGGLLFPVLVQRGYPSGFSLGLVTTSGAVGLLLPPSPLVLIYCYVTGVDVTRAYKATLWPGLALVLLLAVYSVYISLKHKVPTQPFAAKEAALSMWDVKWEALAPVLVLVGLGSGLMELHESAAGAALYTLIVEVYIHKDLSWRKVLRVVKDAASLAGALIVILAMAAALTNYIIHAGIPRSVLEWCVKQGMTETWHFLIVMNVFLFIMGALMDAFSVLLVGLPLLVPLAASFGLHPFYLAAMFLLHLEIAYITPPIGLNLFIASFRFKKPVVEVYRVVMPFFALLVGGFVLICLWEPLSTFTVKDEIAKIRADSERLGVPPTEAWVLECIQEDRNNVLPCAAADIAKWGKDGKGIAIAGANGDDDDDDDDDEESTKDFDDDAEPVGSAAPLASGAPVGSAAPVGSGDAEAPDADDDDDDDDDEDL